MSTHSARYLHALNTWMRFLAHLKYFICSVTLARRLVHDLNLDRFRDIQFENTYFVSHVVVRAYNYYLQCMYLAV